MTDPTHGDDWARLTRYFAGECSPGETRDIEQWIAADPVRAEMVGRLRAAWVHALEPEVQYDVPRAWGEMTRRRGMRESLDATAGQGIKSAPRPFRIRTSSGVFSTTALHSTSRRTGIWAAGIAAALMLAVGTLAIR